MSLLTDQQIQAQVSAIRRTLKNGARHYGIRHIGPWSGASLLCIDGLEHLVLPCISDLQAREALLRADQENKPAILLCAIREEEIGDDVIERLAKRRVFSPQVPEMVAELFCVSPAGIDPRVRKCKALMDALLERVPPEGYPPMPGGVLDLQTAWLTLLGRIVGEKVESPSLAQLLEWSRSERKLQPLASLPGELKDALVDWLARSRSEAIRPMFAAIDAGHGADLIALGAALGLVFDPEHGSSAEHQIARGRLERYFGHRAIAPESALVWSRASEALLAGMSEGTGSTERRPILNRLDEFLENLGLASQAWISDFSPLGLEQRYRQMGQALGQAPGAKDPRGQEGARGALALIRRHRSSEADPERLSRIEMALRLRRWLQIGTAPPPGAPFDALAAHYHQEGGFIDWARHRLKETDEAPEVQKAFAAILRKVEERAEASELQFARQMQTWTRQEERLERIVPIEDFLQEVLLPVAKQQPVLLLVLDGMSVAVFRQLLQDLLRSDWTEIAHEGLRLPRPIIATVPSITSISRRALFLGRLDPARNGTEEGGFKANDLLFHGSGGQVRPQLFKMGDLAAVENGGIPSAVRTAMADRKCRVVSVVLNAIDDHLDSGKQVDFVWTRNSIRGFRDLLRQAAEAGRLILMTSDHGHVLDVGSKLLTSAKEGRGDRFRPADGTVQDGELEFAGPRILQATGVNRLTVACAADVRYGEGKRGYHGGANPQEIVVPLAILSDVRATTAEGWREVPPYQPEWWRIEGPESVAAPPPKVKPEKTVQGLELFERVSSGQAAREEKWIAALLKSPIYREQAKLAVRRGFSDDLMAKVLRALEARGGTALKPSLAQDLGLAPFRADGLILNVCRILNVDGYEVIGFDRTSDTVTLNTSLLRTQFDLGEAS